MQFDDSHQQLKAQLMAHFDRASRSVDAAHKKTCEVRTTLDEEEKNEDSRMFKLTQRINGAKIQEALSPPQPVKGEEEDDEETTVHSDNVE